MTENDHVHWKAPTGEEMIYEVASGAIYLSIDGQAASQHVMPVTDAPWWLANLRDFLDSPDMEEFIGASDRSSRDRLDALAEQSRLAAEGAGKERANMLAEFEHMGFLVKPTPVEGEPYAAVVSNPLVDNEFEFSGPEQAVRAVRKDSSLHLRKATARAYLEWAKSIGIITEIIAIDGTKHLTLTKEA